MIDFEAEAERVARCFIDPGDAERGLMFKSMVVRLGQEFRSIAERSQKGLGPLPQQPQWVSVEAPPEKPGDYQVVVEDAVSRRRDYANYSPRWR